MSDFLNSLQRRSVEVGHLIVPLFSRVHASATDIVWSLTGSNEFPTGGKTYRMPVDLSRYDEMRFSFFTVVGSGGSFVASLQYATTATATVAGHVGSTSPTLTLAGTNQARTTGWVDMVSGAQAEVWISMVQTGASGASRELNRVVAEFRAKTP